MKILIVSRGLPCEKYPMNGIFELDQARALAKNGQEVFYLALDFRPFWIIRKWGFSHSKDNNLHIFILSIPIGRYRKSIYLLQQFLIYAYRKIVKIAGKPDVVHAHFHFMSVISSVLKLKYKLPFIITEHASSLNYNIADINKRDVRLFKLSFENADKIITVSPGLQESVKKHFGFSSEVVHNVVDADTFRFYKRSPNNIFTFLSVGSLQKRKGFDMLIKSFYLAKFDSNVYLKIIGEGEEYENLQRIIDEYKLDSQIKLLGGKNRQEIMEEMKCADAFVLASRGETFGVVYIEAMLTGLPIISTKCGGPEYFTTPENGILVQKDEEKQLTKALLHMKNNAYKYDSKHISELCFTQFSPKSIALQLLKVYDTAVM